MIGVYGVVVTLLLLFPWFLISIMVVGAMWNKVSTAVRQRSARERRGRPAMPWAPLRPPVEIRSGETA